MVIDIGISFAILIYTVFYIASKISGAVPIVHKGKQLDVEVFKPLFFIFGLLLMAFNIEILALQADADGTTAIAGLLRVAYGGIIWPIMPFVILFFTIQIVYNIISTFQDTAEKGKNV